jgi:class 3 adenylate cyclase
MNLQPGTIQFLIAQDRGPEQTGGPGPAKIVLALLLVVAIGAALIFWLRRRVWPSRSAESTCGHCGYVVTGLPTFACPECGSDLRDVGITKGRPLAGGRSATSSGNRIQVTTPASVTAQAAAKMSQSRTAPSGQSRTLTILFTDMKDFTARAAAASRESLLTMLRANKQVVESAVNSRGGTVVKTIGDACLVTFDSATDAVLSGLEIQRAADRHNSAATAGDRLELRIGVSTGEATLTDGDVFGTAVNIAARVQNLAEVGEVYFTESTWHAMNAAEVPNTDLGPRELKGIATPVRVYRADRGASA